MTAVAPPNMKAYRIGWFSNDLSLVLMTLSGEEIKATLRFRLEYLLTGADGLRDDDSDLIRRTKFKRWPRLKAKLLAQGLIRVENGVLRDGDLELSVKKQRDAREHGRKGALIRWSVGRIGGDA